MSYTASPAAAFATTAFTDAEKADIRRFCGYPPYGAGAAGFQSWRYFQAYGLLEFRIGVGANATPNMAVAELQNIRYAIGELYAAEAAGWGARDNLDTDQAAIWTHNKREVQERRADLNMKRREFCELVGVPPGPNLGTTGQPALIV